VVKNNHISEIPTLIWLLALQLYFWGPTVTAGSLEIGIFTTSLTQSCSHKTTRNAMELQQIGSVGVA